MSFKPPCPVTLDKVSIGVEDLEPILRPPESKLLQRPYSPRLLPLPDGRKMVVRMAKREFYFTTKAQWEDFVKPKYAARMGQRPVPEQVLKDSEKLKAPEKIDL